MLPIIRKIGSYFLTNSIEQKQVIKRSEQERAYRTNEHYQAVYTKLYEAFKIPRYQDLTAEQFDNAMKLLVVFRARTL
ncbi:ORF6C domain-containing protein [Gilliamella sp. B2865]|uniref:ORF6C domain-containing protein n=1 Tax=unclassified Gilliamella TaxID=2685620 RepID=UPI00226AA6AB|nr:MULTISPECIES: ORF6C domain-containing protein [unclassified Gilliamella]MCX8669832.1 ORF6C domain-containing protein [Gilliamella sp. B2785]MCX8678555.1 ORF6C domain-containing protein [Gilliamella sp. B2865]